MPKIIYHDSSGVEREIELGVDPVYIGRAVECQIQTQDGLVSRRHARIVYDGMYWIEDLGSSNGVYVESQKVQRIQLRPGDTAVCGSLTLRFVPDVAGAIRRTQGMAAAVDDGNGAASARTPAAPAQPVHGAAPYAPLVYAPPAAAPPPYAPPAQAQTPDERLLAELERERRKCTDMEFERDEALRKVAELQRKIDQLESSMRRSRGGAPPVASLAPDTRALEEERDRLRARVAELEAQPTQAPQPAGEGEGEKVRMLQRQVEQLQSQLRTRGRSGAGGGPDPRVAELEARLRQVEAERDALQKEASSRTPATVQIPGSDRENALKQQLREVERERDTLRQMVAGGAGAGFSKPPQRAIECMAYVSDGLADIRAALRAAGDDSAVEQLEQIRAQLRELASLMKLEG